MPANIAIDAAGELARARAAEDAAAATAGKAAAACSGWTSPCRRCVGVVPFLVETALMSLLEGVFGGCSSLVVVAEPGEELGRRVVRRILGSGANARTSWYEEEALEKIRSITAKANNKNDAGADESGCIDDARPWRQL